MQALIKKFMPTYVFTLTCAATCSKPRIGEFGGGWIVVSRDEIHYGNTWISAHKIASKLKDKVTASVEK